MASTAQPHQTNRLITILARTYVILALPFLLALISIRLVMTPFFLQIEYNLPGFPEDYYGFTREDRLDYAPSALEYLLNGADIDFLGDLRFPDGSSMYNVRELHHMRDVKSVTQYAYLLAVIGSMIFIIAMLYLYVHNQQILRHALWTGAFLTFGIIAAIIIIAILNWDFFLHRISHTLFQ